MTILYHYTTPKGLDGIITNKHIWASDYRFLNDATELGYGMEIFDEEFKILIDQEKEQEKLKGASEAIWLAKDHVEKLRQWTGGDRETLFDYDFINLHIFIVSFSNDGDLLSQWRGYTDGFGYSLGIEKDHIADEGEKQGFKLTEVVYDYDKQRDKVREGVNSFKKLCDDLDALKKSMAEDEWSVGSGRIIQGFVRDINQWWVDMLVIFVTIKNKHFIEEGEWRLIRIDSGQQIFEIKTRASESGMIPYSLFKFNIVEVNKVVIGPSLHQRQILSTRVLLGNNGFSAEIVKSDIPYVAE